MTLRPMANLAARLRAQPADQRAVRRRVLGRAAGVGQAAAEKGGAVQQAQALQPDRRGVAERQGPSHGP